jgi:replication factor C subunit 3/5
MFFVDKHAPNNANELLFHKKELELLKKMSQDDSVPHIIFYGPEGSGKKTLIKLFLEMMYDKEVHNLNDSVYKVSGSGNSTTDVLIKQSNYHIIIEPNNNNFDRYLIQDVVKDYAKKIPLNVFSATKTFKTVLINNVDNLSYYAQTSLRRTMEKFSGTCRFIMWCRSLSRVIDPIRSRCYTFRINSPHDDEILEMIATISYKESMKLTLNDYSKIIKLSNGNIKKALWLLQLKKNNIKYTISYNYIINEIKKLLLTCDVNAILEIRLLLYNIMITNITGSQIIKDIISKLYNDNNIPNECKVNMAEVAAKFEHNLIRGRREIIHLEGFIANLMYVLSKYGKVMVVNNNSISIKN